MLSYFPFFAHPLRQAELPFSSILGSYCFAHFFFGPCLPWLLRVWALGEIFLMGHLRPFRRFVVIIAISGPVSTFPAVESSDYCNVSPFWLPVCHRFPLIELTTFGEAGRLL